MSRLDFSYTFIKLFHCHCGKTIIYSLKYLCQNPLILYMRIHLFDWLIYALCNFQLPSAAAYGIIYK